MYCLTLREGDVLVVGESRLIVSRLKNHTVRLAMDVPDHIDVERIPAPATEPSEPAAEASAPAPTWSVTARRGGPRR